MESITGGDEGWPVVRTEMCGGHSTVRGKPVAVGADEKDSDFAVPWSKR
jgi:hypothetical protein